MKINVWDLPHNKIYVKLSDKFVENTLMKDVSYKLLSEKIGTPYSSIYSWCNRHMFPLVVIVKISLSLGISLDEIQNNIVEIRSGKYPTKGGNLSTPVFPNFPIRESKEISRLLIHLLCDDCITVNKKGHYDLQYYNQCKELREQFKLDARNIFGDVHTHEAINKGTPYIFLPAPVSIVMLSLSPTFNSHECVIPEFIMNSNGNLKKEVISTLFDDESNVDVAQKRIEFSSCNKKMIDQTKKLLGDFNINTSITSVRRTIRDNKTYISYYFYIRGYGNLIKYHSKISFYHTEKKVKLLNLLNSYKRIPKVN